MWVQLMADYSSTGIWDKDGCEMSEEDLPISPATLVRLRDWCRLYEQSEMYLPEKQRAPFDIEGFAEAGLYLAQTIKEELPTWTVVYFDERNPSGTTTYEVTKL